MCARKGGYEDLTKEILRHFETYGFLNPVIIQCDKEMNIFDVCRKVARERNARTVLHKQASHQSNGFVEAVHAHKQGLARCYQTQIETNTDVQLSAISPAIHFAGFVLSRFTVRPDGRTPFQYLLGTAYVSPLRMFGESVFALIPDHEVRAAKVTNRWISGCWLGRDASSDEHLVGTKQTDVKRLKLEGRSGILTWKWILEHPDGLWNDVETRECRQQRHRWKFLQYLDLHLHLKNTYPRCEFTATAEEAMSRPKWR